MLELAHPWALALLPLPALVLWLAPPRRERTPALRVPFFDGVVQAAGAEPRSGAVIRRRTWLQRLALGLCWALAVTALAKPQRVGDPVVRTMASRDVMLAVDLSGSMSEADFRSADGAVVTRFAAVQRVIDGFVAAREGDRVGLIVFGNRAYLQLPLTRDLATARALVALMDVGIAGPQTALGDAIGLAIRAFENSGVEERLLILLTDGSDTASAMTPVNAAGIARNEGVEIHTVGVGDPEATGEERVDFDVLRAVAEGTGGTFHTAEDEAGLAAVYERIDALRPAEVRTESWRPRASLAHWPAGAASVLALLGYGALGFARRRVPHR